MNNFGVRKQMKEILSDYDLVKYGDIFNELKNGVDERNYIEKSDIKYLKVSNIKNNEIAGKIANISVEPNKGKLVDGDLLITRKGTVGESNIFNKEGIYYASSEIFIIKLKEKFNDIKINNYYISLINNFDLIQKQFKDKYVGAMMPSISQPHLKEIKIPLPPLEIQNQIVKKMDRALEIKKQKEKEAKDLLESIDDYVLNELGIKYEEVEEKKIFGVNVSDLLESKRMDPKGYSVKFREIKKAINNSKYELIKFEDLVLKKVAGEWGKEIGKGGDGFIKMKVLRNTNFVNNKNLSFEKVAERNIEEKKFQKGIVLEKGDILIEKSGGSDVQPVGRVAVFELESKDYTFSNFLHCFKVNKNIIVPDYLFSYFKSIYRLKYMEYIQNQTTGIRNLIMENFLEIKIPLPPLEIQEKIANEVKSRIEKAEQLEKDAKEVYENAKSEVEEMILV